jgi:HEAT repeats
MALRLNRFRWIASLACVLGIAYGVGIPHLSISDLVNTADIIVVADVSRPKLVGSAPPVKFHNQLLAAQVYSSDVRVRTLLKGKAPEIFTISYILPQTFIGYRSLNEGSRILFLHYEKDQYMVANPYYPSLPAVVPSLSGDTEGSNVPLAVLHRLADVLASGTTSLSRKNEVLQIGYALPTDDYLLNALRVGIANAQDAEIRQALQRELVIRGDLPALSSVAKLLLTDAALPNQKPGLLYAIGSQVKDSRGVPAVKMLLRSNDSSVRRAAAEALWHIGSPPAIEPAIQALNDPDPQVRYYAIRALADITGDLQWGPSIPEYEENGKKYLDHWLDWANSAAAVRQK